MFENNMKSNTTKHAVIQPQEEFLRQVLFMKDDDKLLAVFPFYHNISDKEYDMVVNNFFSDDELISPPKSEFCLMHEAEFGWGWIHKGMIEYLELAYEEEYGEFKDILISKKVIKETFILNEG